MPGRPGDGEGYTQAVLVVAASVPRGRVTTYGDVYRYLRTEGWTGHPRAVGQVMARHGGLVPWWRVVRADGGLPVSDLEGARRLLLDEDVPMAARYRVDLSLARAPLG